MAQELKENPELQEEKRTQISDEKRIALCSQVLLDYENANNEIESWKSKKAEGLRLLLDLLPEKNRPFKNCANLNVPLIRTVLETLHSNIINSFDYDLPVEAVPVGPEDVARARKINRFLNWQFTNEIPAFELYDKLASTILTYGHAVAKIRYIRQENEGEVLFDGVRIDVPNVEDVLFPHDAPTANVDEMDFIIHRIYMSRSDINERIKSGTFENVKLPEKLTDDRVPDTLDYERKRYLNLSNLFRGQRENMPEVLEWHGYYDLNDDGINEKLVVTVLKQTKQILKIRQWKGSRPFEILRVSPIVNSPWGESVSDLLMHINQELNTLHNQRVDAVSITNMPFGFYDPLSGVPTVLDLEPGKLYPVNGAPNNAVYFPTMSVVRPEMYREEELLFSYAERLLGAGANVQGITNQRRTSATEIATVDRRAGVRFFTLFMRFREGIGRIAKKVFELDQKHFPPEKQVRIMGVQDAPFIGKTHFPFEKFTDEQMQGKVDIVIRGRSVLDVQAEKQEKLQVYQLALLNPIVQTDPMNVYNLTVDTLQALGVKNIDRYLKPPAQGVPKTPEEEHNLVAQGEEIEINLLDDFTNHLDKHSKFLASEQFKMLPKQYQTSMYKHYAQTVKVKQILDEQEELRKQAMIEMGNRNMGLNGQTAVPQGQSQ